MRGRSEVFFTTNWAAISAAVKMSSITTQVFLTWYISISFRTSPTPPLVSIVPAHARWLRGTVCIQPKDSLRPACYRRMLAPREIQASYRPTGSCPAENCVPGFAAPCASGRYTISDSFLPHVDIHVSCRTARRLRHPSPTPLERRTSCKSAADDRRRSPRESHHLKSAQFPPAHCVPPSHASS